MGCSYEKGVCVSAIIKDDPSVLWDGNNFLLAKHLTAPKQKYLPSYQRLRFGQKCEQGLSFVPNIEISGILQADVELLTCNFHVGIMYRVKSGYYLVASLLRTCYLVIFIQY